MTKPRIPVGVRACLFDLDGVLTPTAAVHAAAWKEMFDAFLRHRDGDGFRPSTPPPTTTRTWTDAPLRRVRTFLAARGIELPRARRTTRPTPRPCTASATARTTWCWRRSANRASTPTRLRPLRAGRTGGRAAHRRGLLQRQLP
ncbi:hypothetical protein NKH77_05265 [Streptomyces sp. M19]